jgi:hypothetical protein
VEDVELMQEESRQVNMIHAMVAVAPILALTASIALKSCEGSRVQQHIIIGLTAATTLTVKMVSLEKKFLEVSKRTPLYGNRGES